MKHSKQNHPPRSLKKSPFPRKRKQKMSLREYFFDSGFYMTILIGILGIFFFSVMPIITAAAMDQVPKGIEGSGTALMFSGLAIIGSVSPLIAGAIYQRYFFEGVVYYSGAIALIATLLSLIMPMKKSTS